jgi:phage gp29-like protein
MALLDTIRGAGRWLARAVRGPARAAPAPALAAALAAGDARRANGWRTLSMTRPAALPRKAPSGTEARELPFDQWVDHPGFACTPQRVVAIFRLAEAGWLQQQCDLFDDLIEVDCHLRNLFEQRAQAVAGKDWVVQAGGPDAIDAEAANVLGDALSRLAMTEAIEHLLAFNRYGFAAVEIDWGVLVVNGRTWVVPVHLACVPARRFRLAQKTEELRLLTMSNTTEGVPLTPGKWVIVRRAVNSLARSALMRTAAWPALYKRFGTRDWVVYAEKFGIPLPIVAYSERQDEHSKEVAEEIAENIGNDGAAVVPKDAVEVEIVDAGRSGDSSGTHGGLIAFCNREMSKCVNGSTLSNDAGESGSGGSYGLGEVHDSVRWEAVQYDARRVMEALKTQLAVPFAVFNDLDVTRPAKVHLQVMRDLDPKVRSELADTAVNKLRMRISRSQVMHELGFQEPLNDEDAIEPAPEPAVSAGGGE